MLKYKDKYSVLVRCFRHLFEESGRETNFEDFEIADLDGTLKTFYAGAQKDMYMYNV